jgi:hypothetical protein
MNTKNLVELYEENRWLGLERALQAVFDAGVAAGRQGMPIVEQIEDETEDATGAAYFGRFTKVV